jgi:hypothetical protein
VSGSKPDSTDIKTARCEVRTLFRRHTGPAADGVTFCDRSAQVCTPCCRSAAQLDRVRAQALAQLPPLRSPT